MENKKDFFLKIAKIAGQLKCPKDLKNEFGGYNYRSAEQVLSVAKPIVSQHGLCLFLTDDILKIGDDNYVKSIATITDGDNSAFSTAWAREAKERKGMDSSQLTGCATSYARKYALGGLFGIDDGRDPDSLAPYVDSAQKKMTPDDKFAVAYKQQYSAPDDTVDIVVADVTSLKARSGIDYFRVSDDNKNIYTCFDKKIERLENGAKIKAKIHFTNSGKSGKSTIIDSFVVGEEEIIF
jgi:hypothetical protein